MIHQSIKATIAALCLAVFSHAELQGMQDHQPAKVVNDGKKALVSFGGGNSLIARDGTIFTDFRIGVEWNPYIATGIFGTFIMDDVKNPNIKTTSQMIDYNSYGAFVEVTPYRNGIFALSFPIGVGFGSINTINSGDEELEETDHFFVAEAAAQFNFRLTRILEVSFGGGYRLFAGVEENNLDNGDFRTPFGILKFTIKE